MFNWFADRVFGPVLSALLAWSPWLWVAACAIVALYLLINLPVAFKRWWQVIVAVALVGGTFLWGWQHFAGVEKLKQDKAAIERKLEDANARADKLTASIDEYTATVARLEARQREIRAELAEARVGLDSGTIIRESNNDPVKAAADLSNRWNNLGRMSDAETRRFGSAAPSAAVASAYPDARR